MVSVTGFLPLQEIQIVPGSRFISLLDQPWAIAGIQGMNQGMLARSLPVSVLVCMSQINKNSEKENPQPVYMFTKYLEQINTLGFWELKQTPDTKRISLILSSLLKTCEPGNLRELRCVFYPSRPAVIVGIQEGKKSLFSSPGNQ